MWILFDPKYISLFLVHTHTHPHLYVRISEGFDPSSLTHYFASSYIRYFLFPYILPFAFFSTGTLSVIHSEIRVCSLPLLSIYIYIFPHRTPYRRQRTQAKQETSLLYMELGKIEILHAQGLNQFSYIPFFICPARARCFLPKMRNTVDKTTIGLVGRCTTISIG